MHTATIVGLDIAKSVFQVHGIDADDNIVVRRQFEEPVWEIAILLARGRRVRFKACMSKTFRDWSLDQALLFPPSVHDFCRQGILRASWWRWSARDAPATQATL